VAVATTQVLFHIFAILAKVWALHLETDRWTAVTTIMIGLNAESVESANKTVANKAAVMTRPFNGGDFIHVIIPEEEGFNS